MGTIQDYVRRHEGSYDAATHAMTWTSELCQPDPYPPAKYRMIEVFNGDSRILTMTGIGSKSGNEQLLGTIPSIAAAIHKRIESMSPFLRNLVDERCEVGAVLACSGNRVDMRLDRAALLLFQMPESINRKMDVVSCFMELSWIFKSRHVFHLIQPS